MPRETLMTRLLCTPEQQQQQQQGKGSNPRLLLADLLNTFCSRQEHTIVYGRIAQNVKTTLP
jgi:hypothetical protein